MTNTNYNINSKTSVYAMIAIICIGAAAYLSQPGFVLGFVGELGFTEQQAGITASSEMWGVAISTIALTFLTNFVNWRKAIGLAVLIMALGNILSLFTLQNAVTFAATRGVVGLGEGVFISLGFTMLGLTRDTDRNFGLMVMGTMLFSAFAIALMPTIYSSIGMTGLLIIFIFMSAIPLLLVKNLPEGAESVIDVENVKPTSPIYIRVLSVLSVFTFFVAIASIWAYLFLLGLKTGAEEQSIGNTLMMSSFAGALGGFATAALANRFGRVIPVIFAVSLCLVSQFFMAEGVSFMVFFVSVLAFNFFMNMGHPYLLAILADLDRSGGLIKHAVSGQMLGIALGPLLTAAVLGPDDLKNVIVVSVMFFAITLVCTIPTLLYLRKNAERNTMNALDT